MMLWGEKIFNLCLNCPFICLFVLYIKLSCHCIWLQREETWKEEAWLSFNKSAAGGWETMRTSWTSWTSGSDTNLIQLDTDDLATNTNTYADNDDDIFLISKPRIGTREQLFQFRNNHNPLPHAYI
jgi:hypothetical protein